MPSGPGEFQICYIPPPSAYLMLHVVSLVTHIINNLKCIVIISQIHVKKGNSVVENFCHFVSLNF